MILLYANLERRLGPNWAAADLGSRPGAFLILHYLFQPRESSRVARWFSYRLWRVRYTGFAGRNRLANIGHSIRRIFPESRLATNIHVQPYCF